LKITEIKGGEEMLKLDEERLVRLYRQLTTGREKQIAMAFMEDFVESQPRPQPAPAPNLRLVGGTRLRCG
jgi:hypothetical protein